MKFEHSTQNYVETLHLFNKDAAITAVLSRVYDEDKILDENFDED